MSVNWCKRQAIKSQTVLFSGILSADTSTEKNNEFCSELWVSCSSILKTFETQILKRIILFLCAYVICSLFSADGDSFGDEMARLFYKYLAWLFGVLDFCVEGRSEAYLHAQLSSERVRVLPWPRHIYVVVASYTSYEHYSHVIIILDSRMITTLFLRHNNVIVTSWQCHSHVL